MATSTTNEPPAVDQQPEDGSVGRVEALAAAVATFKDAGRLSYRNRYGLAPYGALAATWGGGMLLNLTEQPWWTGGAVTAAAAGLASLWPKVRAAARRHPVRVPAALLTTAGYSVAATVDSPFGWAQSALFSAGLLVSAPWWWKYRLRTIRPEPKRRELEAAKPKAIEGPDENTLLWAKKPGSGRGVLAGSYLTNRTPFQYGTRYRIILEDQTTEDAMEARARIASAYGKPLELVYVEETTDGAQNAADLTLLNEMAVQDVQYWTAPTLDPQTGIMSIGPYADGAGEARIQIWEPGSGPLPMLICGAMRVGKSTILRLLFTELSNLDHVVPMFCDPQRGQSCPEWMSNLAEGAVARGVEETKAKLLQLREEMYARNAMLAEHEWTDEDGEQQTGKHSYTHPGMCGLNLLYCFIDEAHKVLAYDDIAELVQELLAEGSKAGIMLGLITQVPTVDELGNGRILSLVTSGNVVLLRTGDAYSARSALQGRMQVDAHKIRKSFPNGQPTKGLGYVYGWEPRPVLMRARVQEKPAQWAKSAPRKTLVWMAHGKRTTSETTAAAPAGSDVADVADLDALLAQGAHLGNVIEFAPFTPEQKRQYGQRIYDALKAGDGPLTGGDLIVRTGIPAATAFRVLQEMTGDQALVKSGDDYRLPAVEEVAQ
ncbi:hypothetical protein ACQP1V_42895 (plasmid) [Microtetraspora malaysiensis]|uniref:hypothetical protein n=1 Tax=Microtetraspora malaysiensis TaxID=161358 RepID=UPI003D950519